MTNGVSARWAGRLHKAVFFCVSRAGVRMTRFRISVMSSMANVTLSRPNLLVNENTLHGDTTLARLIENSHDQTINSVLHISVFVDNTGSVAAEFQDNPFSCRHLISDPNQQPATP